MVEMMEIMELKKRDIYEDVVIIGGLIGVQFVYAGNSVLLSYLMSTGIRPLTIVIFSAFSTFLIISPIATYFERFLLSLSLSDILILGMVFPFPCYISSLSSNENFHACIAGADGSRNSASS